MGAGSPLLHFIPLLSRPGHRLVQVSLRHSFRYLIPQLRCDPCSLSLLSLAFKALLTVPSSVLPPPLKTSATFPTHPSRGSSRAGGGETEAGGV